MITLKSDRLRVELPMPGEHPNDSLRFDRAGYISEVILDGGMHFCASEPRNLVHPSSGGRGLCCEFRCDVSNEARVGEYFPKFGVGLIRKEEDDKYIFYKQYQDVKPFPVEVSQKENMVEFITQGIPCLGYNMRVCKNIMLEDDTLTMLIQKIQEKKRFICRNSAIISSASTGWRQALTMSWNCPGFQTRETGGLTTGEVIQADSGDMAEDSHSANSQP